MDKRQNNFELLRIVAILLILLAHFSQHGVMDVSGELAVPYERWFEGPVFNRWFTAFFVGGGDTGVGVFFMITGYFLVNSSRIRDLRPILTQAVFYAVIAFIMLVIARYAGFYQYSLTDMAIQLMLPVSGGVWWFVSSYILLSISYPSLNSFIKQLTRRRFLAMILILWALWFSLGKVLDVEYYHFLKALWFYFIGAYISLYQVSLKKSYCISGFTLSWIIYIIMTYMIASYTGSGLGFLMRVGALKLARAAVFAPLCALFLFLLFKDFKIKDNRFIDIFAPCSLAVYLLHDSFGGKIMFWKVIFDVNGPIYDTALFPLYTLFVIICIIALSLALEYLRKLISKPLIAYINKVTKAD